MNITLSEEEVERIKRQGSLSTNITQEDFRSRIFLTKFPIGDKYNGPQNHGDFDEYYFWRKTYWLGGENCYFIEGSKKQNCLEFDK